MSRCRTAILPENRGILFIMAKEVKPIILSEDFKIGALGHTFNVSIAKAFGLTEAILLQNFYHWHQCNKGNDEMFKDGRVWFFRSVAQIVECYPYLSPDKVRYAIERLIESGFLFKGNYSDDKLKKTSWYSLSDRTLSLFGENNTPFGKIQNDLGNSQLNYNNKDIDNNIEKEKEIDKSISKKKALSFDVRADLSYVDEEFSDIWNEWLDYKDEIKKQYKTQRGAKMQYASLLKYADNNVILANAIVKRSIEQSWDGVFELSDKQKTLFLSSNSPYAIEVPVSTTTESKDTICINGQIYR